MKTKAISTFFRNSAAVASLVAASTLTVGFLAPSASAGTLVPQREGEIELTNIPCAQPAPLCIDTTALPHPYTVTSLPFDPRYDLSRLFVDLGSTANTYNPDIFFRIRDAGTNPQDVRDEFWFRPVAFFADGRPPEGGRLEVGRFRFDFLESVEVMELALIFFDVEDPNFTGILEINDTPVNQFIPAGPDGSIQTVTLNNVSSFVVQLGQPMSPTFPRTGDGVLLQIEKKDVKDVPEPGTIFGLGALAATAALGLRKRNHKAEV